MYYTSGSDELEVSTMVSGEQRVAGKSLLENSASFAANAVTVMKFRVNFPVAVADQRTTFVILPDSYMWEMTVLELVMQGFGRAVT